MTRSWQPAIGAVALVGGLMGSAPAQALTTLDVWLSDFSCSFTSAAGATNTQACQGPGWTTTIGPGESMRIDALVNYRYHDDGLPVTGAYPLQMDPYGLTIRQVSWELGAILVSTPVCQSRSGCYPPSLDSFGTWLIPFILGDNQSPDDLQGSFAAFSGFRAAAQSTLTWNVTAGMSVSTRTYSGTVSPIPEPSTYALMALGLVLVAGSVRWRMDRF
jgi:hypothetical protein